MRIERHGTINSTNTRAKQLARAGADSFTMVLADQQTQGRGRMGRDWHSPPGVSIYMTLIVRPEGVSPERATELVFAGAVALCRACAEESGGPVQIKWPNDLVLNGRKIAGTLLEMSAPNGKMEWAVIGMGVNVLGTQPTDALPNATTIEREIGLRLDRDQLVRRFLSCFLELYEDWLAHGMDAVLPAYRSMCVTLGRRVRVDDQEGVALDLAEDGALLFRLDDGEVISLRAGDVSVRGLMGYV